MEEKWIHLRYIFNINTAVSELCGCLCLGENRNISSRQTENEKKNKWKLIESSKTSGKIAAHHAQIKWLIRTSFTDYWMRIMDNILQNI